MKILLAADGSEHTRSAARNLVAHLNWFAERPVVHILHVRPPFPLPNAAAAVGKSAIDRYEQEEARQALAVAEEVLREAGIVFESHWCLGEPAREIADYAQKNSFDLIAMGAHGHSALRNVAMGSVTTKVLALAKQPVLISR